MSKLLVFLLALLLVACANGPATTKQTWNVEGLTIEFEHPQTAVLLQNYDLFVTVRDATQQPIDGADVALDLQMPGMPMGTNRPVADGLGNGRYKVTTAYNMEGDWVIVIEVAAQGKQVRASYEQTVKPQ